MPGHPLYGLILNRPWPRSWPWARVWWLLCYVMLKTCYCYTARVKQHIFWGCGQLLLLPQQSCTAVAKHYCTLLVFPKVRTITCVNLNGLCHLIWESMDQGSFARTDFISSQQKHSTEAWSPYFGSASISKFLLRASPYGLYYNNLIEK